LIGVFGQAGHPLTRRANIQPSFPDVLATLLDGEPDGVGWTIVKHIFPERTTRRLLAYLAAPPRRRVPFFDVGLAKALAFSWEPLCHIKYDFGSGGAAVTRTSTKRLTTRCSIRSAFDTNVSGTVATVYGNGYRLSNLESEKTAIDKTFSQLQVEK